LDLNEMVAFTLRLCECNLILVILILIWPHWKLDKSLYIHFSGDTTILNEGTSA